ncbi:MAG: AIR carboxylase family protein [Bacteriovoracaceae bacterium]|nr:AIR carboxylase family protein [Bacteriovoracaceae bacterium]
MKTLVLFGSQSDENVFNPLVDYLRKSFEVDQVVLSAHRNPVELGELLDKSDHDFIVAGAGLAAHLPGVVASKVKVPVFGIPVAANFGGLDALLSIQQMPFGVPVMSVAPNTWEPVGDLIKSFLKVSKSSLIEFCIDPKITSYEYVTKELNRSREHASKCGFDVAVLEKPSGDNPVINFVSNEKTIITEGAVINVPLLEDNIRNNPYKASTLFDWSLKGGVWVGANNGRNAAISFLKMKDQF